MAKDTYFLKMVVSMLALLPMELLRGKEVTMKIIKLQQKGFGKMEFCKFKKELDKLLQVHFKI